MIAKKRQCQEQATLTTSSRTLTLAPTGANARRITKCSYQVTGTFGASATIHAEKTHDGTNWVACTDTLGNAITSTAAGSNAVLDSTLGPVSGLRFRLASGDGSTSVVCTVDYEMESWA